MFTFAFLVLLAIGIYLLYKGQWGKHKGRSFFGAFLVLATTLFFWFMDFWGEKLWFDAIGYTKRFWNLFLFETGMTVAGALFALGTVSALLLFLPGDRKKLRISAAIMAILFGGGWGYFNWSAVLKCWHGVKTGVADPILGRDTGFYLFSLPFFDNLFFFLLILSGLGVAISVAARFRLVGEGAGYRVAPARDVDERRISRSLYLNTGVLLLVAAAGKYLDRFHLLYSSLGAVSGPGWTDVHIILPALAAVAIFTALMGGLLFVPAGRNLLQRFLRLVGIDREGSPLYTAGLAVLCALVIWLVGLTLIPGAFQNFSVEPNEISYEKPYIKHNIDFTRQGFKLNSVDEQEFPAEDSLSREMIAANQSVFHNVRLWDWRALDDVLRQFQEIRLYYEFNDVDIDRYHYDGQYRQVMVAAREMRATNLPLQSQTFVNEVFKYTHGYGIVLTTVTDFTPEGLPNLLVKNIPPESKYPELAVAQPRIYYGELTDNHVVTNSTEEEFDFPKGEANEYFRYSGSGGVQLSNFWRKFIYAYKLGDFKLLLSSYPTSESRLMFRRQIEKRVNELAPFLTFDGDPYIVNAGGQLYWIIDAYTTSDYYPYSEPLSTRERIDYKEGDQSRTLEVQHNYDFEGVNYIRNSVKAVVNAFDGSVRFYIFDEDDPIIRVWDRIFPHLFRKRDEMPESLREHVRYPTDLLLVQGLVYAKYHMGDPEVFYNQEDLWIRATETYYGEVQPVEPYYIMWQQPDSDKAEFSLILPFTPKNRQVSIGWIAGLCDGENYGRFLAYSFPKDKRVLGPQQVETKIDQNSFLSGQLSLWDQRGSRVIRGNVLAIPVGKTLIYVEPIYLQAETAAYPELRLVCVMHDDKLSYAQTFDEALQGIFTGEAPPAAPAEGPALPGAVTDNALIRQAKQAFDDYLEATGQGRFGEASQALDRLQEILNQLAGGEGRKE